MGGGRRERVLFFNYKVEGDIQKQELFFSKPITAESSLSKKDICIFSNTECPSFKKQESA